MRYTYSIHVRVVSSETAVHCCTVPYVTITNSPGAPAPISIASTAGAAQPTVATRRIPPLSKAESPGSRQGRRKRLRVDLPLRVRDTTSGILLSCLCPVCTRQYVFAVRALCELGCGLPWRLRFYNVIHKL